MRRAVQPLRAAALVLGLCGAHAGADDAMARQQAEQRVRLAERLITDASTTHRILASGNPVAISHLDEGRVHLSAAGEALLAGDYVRARRIADEALQHLGQARRLAPDQPSKQHALRARHEQQVAALERLLEAWRERAVAAGRIDDGWLDATGQLAHARRLGEEQRYDDSLRLLATIEQRVLAGMQRAIGARELDYTERAATPAEAWRLERARHAMLADLVPLALHEMTPREDTRALVERYQHSSQALAAQAQSRHEAGETEPALDLLRVASMYLQRALAAAGVSLTNDSGSNP
ncbi:MAG: hypothetical protein OEU94_08075 [Aquincola sp.]|nr:hypothetical protein [Aquincola sp.]MDH4288567.1 hypothetical protein [Aquincola sp.]MDH5329942.1 hypothetical protein [Aquincola sp.]